MAIDQSDCRKTGPCQVPCNKSYYSLMLSLTGTTCVIIFDMSIRGDQISRHVISAIQISFKLEKLKHFPNTTVICLTACLISDFSLVRERQSIASVSLAK